MFDSQAAAPSGAPEPATWGLAGLTAGALTLFKRLAVDIAGVSRRTACRFQQQVQENDPAVPVCFAWRLSGWDESRRCCTRSRWPAEPVSFTNRGDGL